LCSALGLYFAKVPVASDIFALCPCPFLITTCMPMPENVTRGNGFLRYIKARTEPVLTPEQVQAIINTIDNGRLARSFKTNRDHVAHVKRIMAEKAATPSCPTCGRSMVSRQVKRGAHAGNTIWGCPRYPTCRGLIAQD